MTDFNTTERQMSEIDEKALQTAVDEFRTVHAGNGGNLHASMRRATLAYESAKAAPAGAVAVKPLRRSGAEMIAYHRYALHDDGNTAEVDSNGLAEEIDAALATGAYPVAWGSESALSMIAAGVHATIHPFPPPLDPVALYRQPATRTQDDALSALAHPAPAAEGD